MLRRGCQRVICVGTTVSPHVACRTWPHQDHRAFGAKVRAQEGVSLVKQVRLGCSKWSGSPSHPWPLLWVRACPKAQAMPGLT